MRHPLFVISGPAACGKIELIERMLQIFPELAQVTTHSTRKPRAGESPDRAYTYISELEFSCARNKGLLAEFSLTHGNYHGTLKENLYAALEKGPSIIIRDTDGADKLATLFPDAYFAFIIAPEEEISERLRVRSHTKAELIARMQDVRNDVLFAMHPQYDCIINNGCRKRELAARQLIRFIMERID